MCQGELFRAGSREGGGHCASLYLNQGEPTETTRTTTHEDPIYVEEGVVHYCVTNMPGAVPRTSTIALTNATFIYVMMIAQQGWKAAVKTSSGTALRRGLNLYEGETHLCCRGR